MMKAIIKNVFAVATFSMLLSSCGSEKALEITLWGVPAYEKVTVVTEKKTYQDVAMPIKVEVSSKEIEGQKVFVKCRMGEFPPIVLHKKETMGVYTPLGVGGFARGALIGASIGMAQAQEIEKSSFFVDPSYFEWDKNTDQSDAVQPVDSARMVLDTLFPPQ